MADDTAISIDAAAANGGEQRPAGGSGLGFKILVVLATLITTVSMFAVWADRQVLNADNWTKTSSKLLANPAIRQATSVYVTDQIYRNINVEAELKKAFPDQAQLLAGPAATGLRGVAQDAINQALGTPIVQSVWSAANKIAADQLISVIEERNIGALSFQGNDVKLDLRPAAINLAGKVGLQSQAANIPQGAATVKVFSSNQIGQVRAVAQFLSGVAVLFPLLAIALYAAAVGLSRGRRRKALITVAWSMIVASALTLVLRDVFKGPFVNGVAATDAVKPAVTATYGIGTSMLQSVAMNTIIVAVVLLLAAAIAGPLAPAKTFREWIAPLINERPGLGYAFAYGLLFLVVLWGPIPAVRSWLMLPVFALLTGIGVFALERQLVEEFPDATSAAQAESLRDVWNRITGHATDAMTRGGAAAKQAAGQVRERVSQSAGRDGAGSQASAATVLRAPAASEAPTAKLDAPLDAGKLELLERLGALKASGVISESEFEAEKSKILGG